MWKKKKIWDLLPLNGDVLHRRRSVKSPTTDWIYSFVSDVINKQIAAMTAWLSAAQRLRPRLCLRSSGRQLVAVGVCFSRFKMALCWKQWKTFTIRVCVLLFRARGIVLTGRTGSKKAVIVQQEEEPSGAASYSAQFGAVAAADCGGVCVCECVFVCVLVGGWARTVHTLTLTQKVEKNTAAERNNSFLSASSSRGVPRLQTVAFSSEASHRRSFGRPRSSAGSSAPTSWGPNCNAVIG